MSLFAFILIGTVLTPGVSQIYSWGDWNSPGSHIFSVSNNCSIFYPRLDRVRYIGASSAADQGSELHPWRGAIRCMLGFETCNVESLEFTALKFALRGLNEEGFWRPLLDSPYPHVRRAVKCIFEKYSTAHLDELDAVNQAIREIPSLFNSTICPDFLPAENYLFLNTPEDEIVSADQPGNILFSSLYFLIVTSWYSADGVYLILPDKRSVDLNYLRLLDHRTSNAGKWLVGADMGEEVTPGFIPGSQVFGYWILKSKAFSGSSQNERYARRLDGEMPARQIHLGFFRSHHDGTDFVVVVGSSEGNPVYCMSWKDMVPRDCAGGRGRNISQAPQDWQPSLPSCDADENWPVLEGARPVGLLYVCGEPEVRVLTEGYNSPEGNVLRKILSLKVAHPSTPIPLPQQLSKWQLRDLKTDGICLLYSGELETSNSSYPPMWIVLILTCGAILSDAACQIASRKFLKGSLRRVLIVMNILSTCVILVVLLSFELSGVGFTKLIYNNNEKIECFKGVPVGSFCDQRHNPCWPVACPSQGPWLMTGMLIAHPVVWLVGILAPAYYLAEVFLLQQPLGVALKPLASMTGVICLPLASVIFGLDELDTLRSWKFWFSAVLGLLGTMLCTLEFKFLEKYQRVPEHSDATEASPERIERFPQLELTNPQVRELENPPTNSKRLESLKYLSVLGAFVSLALVGSVWNVLQKFTASEYAVNAFTYASLDQVLGPVIMVGLLMVIDPIGCLRKVVLSPQDQKETFWQAVFSTLCCCGSGRGKGTNDLSGRDAAVAAILLLLSRLLSTTRILVYFYLTVNYDLALVFLLTTLLRVVLSWMWAFSSVIFCPKFVEIKSEEKDRILDRRGLAAKVFGTFIIAIVLLILN